MLHKNEVYYGVKLDFYPSKVQYRAYMIVFKGIVGIEACICAVDDSFCSLNISGLNLQARFNYFKCFEILH